MQKDRQILTEIKKNGQKEGHIKKEQPERRTDSQKERQIEGKKEIRTEKR